MKKSYIKKFRDISRKIEQRVKANYISHFEIDELIDKEIEGLLKPCSGSKNKFEIWLRSQIIMVDLLTKKGVY